ncbi:MAG: Oxygen-dependent coproporphyrinogen-III oxidase [Chlamydiae bacterium]|nr:Oxygen-dependent coproporphyrinogen-III oxidase [Chlamydiota bacterium]
MRNPHAPTVHMNVRYIETQDRFWFGGGYDLTPMGVFYQEDRDLFHSVAKNALDLINPTLYPSFSKKARDYFFIPHRNEERGVGGIFFDKYNTGKLEKDLSLWKCVAESFLPAILPIYKKRVSIPYTDLEKEGQLKRRGHYVEFNLIYDKGTRFGFESGGNPEAILSSMPPLAQW